LESHETWYHASVPSVAHDGSAETVISAANTEGEATLIAIEKILTNKQFRRVLFIIYKNENMYELYKKKKENTNFSLHVAFEVIFYILKYN
jgi:hypothetical protein